MEVTLKCNRQNPDPVFTALGEPEDKPKHYVSCVETLDESFQETLDEKKH